MPALSKLFLLMVASAGCAATQAQTTDELVAKNVEARGGLANIKAITSLRSKGKIDLGGVYAEFDADQMPDFRIRQSLTLQGMTLVQAFDGTEGWKIDPFSGRRDPERLGEEDTRDLVDSSDFYGALVDYKRKGSTVEYIGHASVDGDDALLLKVTLKNGDVLKYYLDPETSLEIRIESLEFIRGKVKESFTNLGSYKKVNGVYFPFSLEFGSPRDPANLQKLSYSTIEANVKIPESEFSMPAGTAASENGAKETRQP